MISVLHALCSKRVAAWCAMAALVSASPLAQAQVWPGKPIRLIVPMPAAGTTDNMGRLAGQKLAEISSQLI